MSALQPALPDPSGPDHDDATPAPSSRSTRPRRRTAVAWPAPAPQALPPGARRRPPAPVVVPDPAPAAPSAPAAATPLPRFVAPPAAAARPAARVLPRFVAPAAPTPPSAPTPPAAEPISLAGADLPAALAPTAPALPPLPETPLVGAPSPAARRTRPARPSAPAEQTGPSAPVEPPAPRAGGSSAAPPGFHGAGLVIAESAELLALDPSPADELDDAAPQPAASAPAGLGAAPEAPRPVLVDDLAAFATPGISAQAAAPVAPPTEIGGSRLLGAIVGMVARPGDRAAFGRDRGATARVATTLILASLLLVALGPAVARALSGVPFIGPAVDGLTALTLYPSVYGLEWISAVLIVASVGAVMYVQMEKRAVKHDLRHDPVRRLNIALATMLALTLGAGAMTLLSRYGWAAAAAATGFYAALCLALPLGKLPGARALGLQPERSWAVVFLCSIPAVVLAPSIPTLLLAVLTFTRVRTHWQEVMENADEHAGGEVDHTNRRSAVIILCGVILASSIGLHQMQQSPERLRSLQTQERTAFPGAEQGPDVSTIQP